MSEGIYEIINNGGAICSGYGKGKSTFGKNGQLYVNQS